MLMMMMMMVVNEQKRETSALFFVSLDKQRFDLFFSLLDARLRRASERAREREESEREESERPLKKRGNGAVSSPHHNYTPETLLVKNKKQTHA